jgi:hypothetical protein
MHQPEMNFFPNKYSHPCEGCRIMSSNDGSYVVSELESEEGSGKRKNDNHRQKERQNVQMHLV